MRVKIRLDTMQDVVKLTNIATKVSNPVTLTDGQGITVSAKSLLGCALFKMEFKTIYCECDTDISGKLLDFII